jgi:hypothetical protein
MWFILSITRTGVLSDSCNILRGLYAAYYSIIRLCGIPSPLMEYVFSAILGYPIIDVKKAKRVPPPDKRKRIIHRLQSSVDPNNFTPKALYDGVAIMYVHPINGSG